jgi:hypothetical protein
VGRSCVFHEWSETECTGTEASNGPVVHCGMCMQHLCNDEFATLAPRD